MHEMSLVAGVMRIIEENAASQDYSVVRRVVLEVGGLSHVDPDAMAFAFDAQKHGTMAADAVLEIVRTEGRAWCMDCAEVRLLTERGAPCPECGGYKVAVVEGDDLRVRELEVD